MIFWDIKIEGHLFNQRSWLISFSQKHVNADIGIENTCDITYIWYWLQIPTFMTNDQQDRKNTNYNQSPG